MSFVFLGDVLWLKHSNHTSCNSLRFRGDRCRHYWLYLNLLPWKRGEHYARSGQAAKKLGSVESGLLRAYYQNPEGEQFNKIFFSNPAIVGAYTSLITKEENQVNIECLTYCEMVEAEFQEILDLYEEHPMIELLKRTIAQDFFVKKEKREISLVMNDASERYAFFQKEHPGLENRIAQ